MLTSFLVLATLGERPFSSCESQQTGHYINLSTQEEPSLESIALQFYAVARLERDRRKTGIQKR